MTIASEHEIALRAINTSIVQNTGEHTMASHSDIEATGAQLDALVAGAFTSKVSAYLGNSQTISHGTWTVVAYDTENWDADTEFDTITNKGRFTAKTAGYYHITARYTMSAIAAGKYAYIRIKKNGSIDIALHQVYPAGSEVPNMQISADVYLDGFTDYIEIKCYHDSGGDETLSADAQLTRVDIHRFG